MAASILIAPDKFKGSLSATEAAAAIAAGIRAVDPEARLDLCPIADGGEGFLAAVETALGGRRVRCRAVDALERDIDSQYVVVEHGGERAAVLEMSETAGLGRLGRDERDPLRATTRGVGMQIADAVVREGVARVILGLGGSATNDGGAGMAAALGVRFLDAAGREFDPTPERLVRLDRIDESGRLPLPPLVAACDVDNPLLGERGATAVFSAQKGSSAATRPRLEAALARLAEFSAGGRFAVREGAGAAGGLGFGLLRFADARLVSGFELVSGLLGLEERVRRSDLVITGEGAIDAQSLAGKGPVALARLARRLGVPVVGYCGTADECVRGSGVFDSLHALDEGGLPLEELIARAGPLLTARVAENERS